SRNRAGLDPETGGPGRRYRPGGGGSYRPFARGKDLSAGQSSVGAGKLFSTRKAGRIERNRTARSRGKRGPFGLGQRRRQRRRAPRRGQRKVHGMSADPTPAPRRDAPQTGIASSRKAEYRLVCGPCRDET